MSNEWADHGHAHRYLDHGDDYPPHRQEGEEVLIAELPERVDRILDLGCGDGRLGALVRAARPGAALLAVDMSPAMLEAARTRFDGDPDVEVIDLDFGRPLPDI